jgi:hypothetical protein
VKRREFITLLGGAAATWPLAANAQQPDQVRRIGVLMSVPENDPEAQAWLGTFSEGMSTRLKLLIVLDLLLLVAILRSGLHSRGCLTLLRFIASRARFTMNIGSLCSKEERRKIKDALACLVLRADPVRDGNATIAIYVHKSVLKFSSVSGLYLSPGSGKRIVSRIDIHFDIQI